MNRLQAEPREGVSQRARQVLGTWGSRGLLLVSDRGLNIADGIDVLESPFLGARAGTRRAGSRRLLERARPRSARIHAGAQSRLERSLARLERGAAAPAADIATLHELTAQAVARLARRLTAGGDGQR